MNGKPEGWRLERAAYPYIHAAETRFQDLDPLGHINNVAMAALFESGRVRFNHSLGLGRRQKGIRWLIAKVEINYVAEAHFPDDVEIASGIGTIGSRSWTILAAAFQNGQCVATCDTVIVFTDTTGAIALPAEMRALLEANRVRQAG
ncbi:acyl-CoA thioesterase [Sphingomonas cavernae]|uniref:Acyl-CoA thioesterase n=1 Tax=Sphingomonas cavernae TaxID=2320861 RepID=A0A418W798_9SPHN|nr:acyl-CoA thioesterase [Sphingomonas cavernae]RJF85901.1 acyl-CoA thioesterase [Sphingomonas cavernae]